MGSVLHIDGWTAGLRPAVRIAAQILLLPVALPASALDYRVEVTPLSDASLQSAVEASSTLIELKDIPPEDLFSLQRRAESDLPRLEKALRSAGYYGGTVAIQVAGRDVEDPALLDEEVAPEGVLPVAIGIEPGKLFTLGAVEVRAARSDVVLPPGIGPQIKAGNPARAANILNERERLLNAILAQGYPFARVDLPPAVVDHATGTVTVAFDIDPGPQATMGPVTISGLTQVDPAFMQQRTAFRPGQMYSPAEIMALRDDLRSLDVFDSVKVTTAKELDANGQLPVAIEVTERKRRFIGFGANYSTNDGAGLKAYWGHRNLFGGAERLRLEAEVGGLGENDLTDTNFAVSAAFRKPDFIERDQDLLLNLSAIEENDDETFDKRAIGGSAGIERRLNEQMSVGALMDIEASQITEDGETDDFLLVGPRGTFRYDTTTDLLNPISGTRLVVSGFAYPQFLGSSQDVFGTSADLSAYWNMVGEGDVVLAGRLGLANVFGGDTADLPADRRLYAGGGGSVRGYEFRSISPLDADDEPLGGRSLVTGSIELRYRFLDNFGLVPFLDFGTVSDDVFYGFDEEVQFAAGLGFRYYTAIGPIRADIAVPLNPRDDDEFAAFYISIGQAF
ncbi:autotransporter assembly complex protein TamA [Dongia mobilis]|uniref:autotransporter assembly complex protein TamA n=1 Tax=Dongia mobilis TaxID=578943 RepID=UPI00106171A1|nr:autotransporter assembly complex family protein [Dongia mobilis]